MKYWNIDKEPTLLKNSTHDNKKTKQNKNKKKQARQ